jgi:CheY-like chemotaxis protein
VPFEHGIRDPRDFNKELTIGHMSTGRERRKILIVGEEPSAREEMRILLGSSGCECTIASNVQQALAMMDQRKFDAIVLDQQSSSSQAAEVISRISEFHPNLIRRVVLITEEGRDSVMGDLVESYSLTRVQRKLLLQQLWSSLESLFRREAVFQNVAQMARLISDSFRDPLPAGVRTVQNRNRTLLYASGSLRVDLLVEAEEGSNRIELTGQILDSAKPDRRFESVPVTLQGWKGLVAHTTAGEFGEFHLNFIFESTVNLEIGIAESQSITISLPPLGRARRSTAGYS